MTDYAMEELKRNTQKLARQYAEQGNPDGWFEDFYRRADGDINKIYWADLKPNPCLLGWLRSRSPVGNNKAVIIGCGLGDDAEALSIHGYHVTAFDISPSAIAMCRSRYPDSLVEYTVADLFTPSATWHRAFSLVYECNTIQILSGKNRAAALKAISELVAPGGFLLVSCRSRESAQEKDAFPIPLDRHEINGFIRAGLNEIYFDAYDDDQAPPVPHFFAVYMRPEG